MGPEIPLFIGTLGTPEIVLVLLIAVLLFGANKIPKLARSTGQALGEFQRGREEIEQELEEVRETADESIEQATNPDKSDDPVNTQSPDSAGSTDGDQSASDSSSSTDEE
jgi:sec-independent protein translocase protein TatA